MACRGSQILSIVLFLLLTSFLPSQAQSELSAKEIVEKNIQAVGGKEALSRVKNYSFKYASITYYMSAAGVMKLADGKEPIITEVIIANKDRVRRNCFNKISELTGIQKSMYQSLAKLRCGLYTLVNFRDQLALKGLKSYGAEKHYVLVTKVGDLEVEFYLDAADFRLRRAVFKGYEPSQGKYEVNHDFGPYQEINGAKIPSSWFASQVGTRGSNFEITEVKVNQPLEKDFFSKLEVNVGKVSVAKGELGGNIAWSAYQRNMLIISTNWTDECMRKAGFKTNDKLILQIGDQEVEIDFYEAQFPRESVGPGSKLMALNPEDPEGENYFVYLISPEYKKLAEKLEVLLPIKVRSK
jgi:hypothetical protein